MTPQETAHQRNQHFVNHVGTPDYDPEKHGPRQMPGNICNDGNPHRWYGLVCDNCGKDVS